MTAATLCCDTDARRPLVRASASIGFDYVEVDAAQTTLSVHFLGRAPDWSDGRFLRLEGGRRIRDLVIRGIGIVRAPDDGSDDVLTVTVDRPGDFSTYRLCAIELDADDRPTGRPHPAFDPRYACVAFGFKASCPSDLDCGDAPQCPPEVLPEPAIDYLAKDYASFRRLLLDRLALIMPGWTERHAPDLGVTLVEVLAYVADELSYYQDAVATEAYLDTARLRTSVRRHVRLVDYRLHEGCNARALIACTVSDAAIELNAADFVVTTKLPQIDAPMVRATALPATEPAAWLTFQPRWPAPTVTLRSARNRIAFYDWGERDCCLPRGATSATLLDPGSLPPPPLPPDHPDYCVPEAPPVDIAGGVAAGQWHQLHLAPCDLLVFEEVIGPRTGDPLDADPTHRHAVRLTRATPAWDPLLRVLLWEVEWCAEDALPFPLCLSATSDAPDCHPLTGVSVAWGNIVVVDHGASWSVDLGTVPEVDSRATCSTDCAAAEISYLPGRYAPAVPRANLTFAAPLAACPGPHDAGCGGCGPTSAQAIRVTDVLAALPEITLTSLPAQRPGAPVPAARQWLPRPDLLASGPDDLHFVVEVDDDRVAWLRFGDGECGRAVEAGERFTAHYRTGSGPAGNVGADTLTQIVFGNDFPDGTAIAVRNPLAASGGTAFEPVAEAKLRAPYAIATRLERAITPADYVAIVERDFPALVQRAAAVMRATGVRTAVEVAIDSIGREDPPAALLDCIAAHLEAFRRIGHDVRVIAAELVSIDLALTVCVADGYLRGHVEAAVLTALGAGRAADGSLGFFHPDRLSFGDAVTVSALVAAVQALAGVSSVVVTRLERLFAGPNDELASGILPLGPLEVARLDGDPDFPENGRLVLTMRGGR